MGTVREEEDEVEGRCAEEDWGEKLSIILVGGCPVTVQKRVGCARW